MATYDLTSKATAFVNQDRSSAYPTPYFEQNVRMIEAELDIAALIADGYTYASGDVFQLLDIEANVFVLLAGAEVTTAFDGTTPAADIDFAGGDDIVDGADLSSTGFCASGTNGTANGIGTAAADPTFTQLQTAADTIDVTLTGTGITEGVLRVYACVIDLKSPRVQRATEVTRDQLA